MATTDQTTTPYSEMGTADTVAYTPRLDRVIYSSPTNGFGRDEWVSLALAALDQAGLSQAEIENVKRALPPRAREAL